MSEHVRETEYLYFVRETNRETGTTQVWQIISKRHGDVLGAIRWYGAWRQYVVYPAMDTLFNTACLADIESHLRSLMNEYRQAHAALREAGDAEVPA